MYIMTEKRHLYPINKGTCPFLNDNYKAISDKNQERQMPHLAMLVSEVINSNLVLQICNIVVKLFFTFETICTKIFMNYKTGLKNLKKAKKR